MYHLPNGIRTCITMATENVIVVTHTRTIESPWPHPHCRTQGLSLSGNPPSVTLTGDPLSQGTLSHGGPSLSGNPLPQGTLSLRGPSLSQGATLRKPSLSQKGCGSLFQGDSVLWEPNITARCTVVNILWPCTHDWTGLSSTVFSDCPIQHVDLVEEVHS